ncbi:hypothetical protein SUGI_0228560 [Cryptomeria japonica]|uniref:protein Iojap-related, mitochondrial-like n=1 Tax=Cryptomeria japonica TaxID=3369 RepID=UPI002408EC07|nr:protein Iojap-related, mitochondrial-like [Cryptomeria japonica]GLJ14230.1 hypothetical protein SUGI_0228560 [Cryptomeria japonica]
MSGKRGLFLLAGSFIAGRATLPACPVPAILKRSFCSALTKRVGALRVEEVEKILGEVRAQDVNSIYVGNHCEWAEYMVLATGKSDWHVRNIAQAILHNIKQKKKNNKDGDEIYLPGIEGRQGGKWLVIDTGSVIVHALHENAREYYDLDSLWRNRGPSNQLEDLENSLKKGSRRRTRPLTSINYKRAEV